ncbi:hypothetical protein O7630_11580 [Micromonospora sp. WMMD718]|uniref:hypothetical protein n=1 Tax=Micromonospora TaxID=1873 RepID=UPI00064BDC54|nr:MULTISPECIES: hypothetical protein [unclassified Micromonospora]MDG4751583.1 hypothetical protein [Micromonospora sp. WMMD718]
MIDENPANDPTREWVVGGPDVAFDARALLRKLDSTGRNIVSHLAARPGRPAAAGDVAAAIGVPARDVEDGVAWINKLAEALGYLPLVVRSDSALLMSAHTCDVARQALIDAQR